MRGHSLSRALGMAVFLGFSCSSSFAENPIFVKLSTSRTPVAGTAIINPPASYSFSAAAPFAGTTWNVISQSNNLPVGTPSPWDTNLYTGVVLKDSTGSTTVQTLTVGYHAQTPNPSTRIEPSGGSGENTIQAGGVMQNAWRNFQSGNYSTWTVSNLTANTKYGLYIYGATTTSGQFGQITNSSAFGSISVSTTNTTPNSNGSAGSIWTVSGGVTSLMPQGTTWNFAVGNTDAKGTFQFIHVGAGGNNEYFNGFQIVPLTTSSLIGPTNQTVIAGNGTTLSATVGGFPVPGLQWLTNGVPISGANSSSLPLPDVQFAQNEWTYSLVATNAIGTVTNTMTLTVIVTPSITGLNNQALPVGSTVNMDPTVTGVPTPRLQWQFNGTNLSEGSTGNGSTVSGTTSNLLTIINAQAADSGIYSLIASNSAGIVTNSMTLTVSGGDVAPSITGPTDQTVVQTSNATFSASVSGLPIPTLQWRVNGTNISAATNSSLSVANVQYSQNGFIYSLVASNTAGMATNSAALHVLVPPVISQQPTNLTVVVSNSATFTATASGVPAVVYQWNRNGVPIANATNASYTIPRALGADNGAVFSLTVTNSVGVAVSSNATLTVLSTTLTGAFLPTNGAVNISPDQQLRVVFSGDTPALAYTGKKLYVRDAADNSLFATIDTSQFLNFTTDSATVSNAFVRTVQGQTFFYMPVAVYSNVAWITLNPTNRLSYGHTYYVNCDAGLFVDSTGAAFPGVTGANAWRFSTKASGPATPTASTGPTNITVALDGAGDFATLQGASDWVPQNNTLKRTITIQPGIYHDFAIFTQGRNNVAVIGAGATRQDVQIIYPNAAYTTGSSCGLVRLESSDIYFRNLTLDNQVYLTNSLDNYGPWAGRLNTLDTTGQRLIFDNVIIKGGQDTLYAISGSAYFNRCEVWGSTDFIYGGALAVFDQCNIVEIRNTGGPCTAPSTPYAQPYGLVFLNCTFPQALVSHGYPYDVGSANTTFMRPWGQDGMTAIINCAVGSQISSAGWGVFGSGTETTCRAREAGTSLISGGTVNVPQVRWNAGAYWANTLDPDYTNNPSLSPTDPLLYGSPGTNNRVVVTVNTNDYTLSSIFGDPYYNLGGWLPTTVPTITAQPTNKSVSAGSAASFSVAAIGLPDPSYQWRKNGTNISDATNAALTIASARLADNGAYSVVVSNTAGVVTSSNATLTIPPQSTAIMSGVTNSMLYLTWPINQTGYRLLAQTNPPGTGLTTNWKAVANSGMTNQIALQINPSNGAVFFRLVYP